MIFRRFKKNICDKLARNWKKNPIYFLAMFVAFTIQLILTIIYVCRNGEYVYGEATPYIEDYIAYPDFNPRLYNSGCRQCALIFTKFDEEKLSKTKNNFLGRRNLVKSDQVNKSSILDEKSKERKTIPVCPHMPPGISK